MITVMSVLGKESNIYMLLYNVRNSMHVLFIYSKERKLLCILYSIQSREQYRLCLYGVENSTGCVCMEQRTVQVVFVLSIEQNKLCLFKQRTDQIIFIHGVAKYFEQTLATSRKCQYKQFSINKKIRKRLIFQIL